MDVDPVETFARSVRPDPVPASIVYEVGAEPPAGAVHCSITVEPAADVVRLVGAPGGAVCGTDDRKFATVVIVAASERPLSCVERPVTRPPNVPPGVEKKSRRVHEGVQSYAMIVRNALVGSL